MSTTQAAKQRKAEQINKADDVPEIAEAKQTLSELQTADADISAKITACERAMFDAAARVPDEQSTLKRGLAAARGEKVNEGDSATLTAQMDELRQRQRNVRAALKATRARIDHAREQASIQFCQHMRPQVGVLADQMIEALMMIDHVIAAENELQQRAALAGFEYMLPHMPDPIGRMNDNSGSIAFNVYQELQAISGHAFTYDAAARMNMPDGDKTKDDVRRAGGTTEVRLLCDSRFGKGGSVVSIPTADVEQARLQGLVDDALAQVEYAKAQSRAAAAASAATPAPTTWRI